MQISWNKLRNNDEQEWKSLFRQHASFLYAYGMKFAHNEDLVKDIVQELFIAIYEKRNSLNEPAYMRAYLCAGLRNRLINELKKETDIYLDEGDYSFTLYIDDQSVDEEEKQYRKIQNLLNKLTNRQREVVYLKYFKGMSNEEIACTLGINKQSVANILSEAIRQMKKDATFIFFLLLVLRRFLGL